MHNAITVLYNWVRESPLGLAAFAHNVVLLLTGNVKFTTPAVPLATLDAAAKRLELAYSNRKNGTLGKLELEAAFADVDKLLHEQADYVDGIAKGDAMVIASAGFEPSKTERVAATVPAQPNIVRVSAEVGGILHVSVDKVAGATSYLYVAYVGDEQSIEVHDNHIVLPAGVSFFVIPDGGVREDLRGLTPGSKVNIVALAQNAAGKSAFSPVTSSFVL